MKIHLIQSDIRWEDPAANRVHLEKLIGKPEKGSLIVLPEMFNTGFTFPSEKTAESMEGPTLRWMKELAKKFSCAITGSLIIEEEGSFFNRMFWLDEQAALSHYDKRHLFRMAGEDEHFKAGSRQKIISWNGWNICLQVCYDLRFPVWSRNRYQDGRYDYDLIIYVANWPATRHHAWEGLLRARAMENIAYCIGVNRVGVDAKGLNYLGGSALIEALGKPILEADDTEGNFSAELDLDALKSFRKKFPLGLDADEFTIG